MARRHRRALEGRVRHRGRLPEKTAHALSSCENLPPSLFAHVGVGGGGEERPSGEGQRGQDVGRFRCFTGLRVAPRAFCGVQRDVFFGFGVVFWTIDSTATTRGFRMSNYRIPRVPKVH